jgi:tetratricopeptide (TPR) repeat protein
MEPQRSHAAVALTGQTLGPYRVMEAIGSGGMGAVYRGWDTRLDRAVAIKTLLPALQSDPLSRKRFVRETRLACKVVHPYVATVLDVLEHEGTVYLIMEFLEGNRLDTFLHSTPPSLPDLTRFASEIAEALIAIHRAGLVHRDLKPGNVMITTDGHVKVMDFGVAWSSSSSAISPVEIQPSPRETTLTGRDSRVGTVMYMSPEQISGKRLDGRSDLFSFGIMLYEAITHVHPFVRDSSIATAAAILNDPPGGGKEPDTLTRSGPLRDIVLKLLEKDHERRYPDAETLLANLRAVARGETPVGLATDFRPKKRFRPFVWPMIAAMALAVLCIAFLGKIRPPTPTPIPEAAGRPGVVVLPFRMPERAKDGALRSQVIASMLRADLAQSEHLRLVGSTRTDEVVGVLPLDPASAAGIVRKVLEATSSRFAVTGTITEESGTMLAAAEVFDLRSPENSIAVHEQASTLAELVDRVTRGLDAGLALRLATAARGGQDRPVVEITSASEGALLAAERGREASTRGNLGGAEGAYAEAVAADPAFVRAHMERARALYSAGYVKRAREAISEADAQAKGEGRPLPERTALELEALRHRVMDDRKGEEAVVLKLVEKYGDDPEVWADLATVYRLSNRLDDAIRAIDQALKRAPSSPGFLLTRATLLRKKGNTADAGAALTAAEQAANGLSGGAIASGIEFERGELSFVLKNFDQARDHYRSAANAFAAGGQPLRLADARTGLARCQLAEGHLEGAFEPLQDAIRAFTDAGAIRSEASALDNLGTLLLRAGKLRQAEATFRQALDLARTLGADTLPANTLVNFASTLNLLGRSDEAKPLAEEANRIAHAQGDTGREVSSLYQLAEVETQNGHLDAAESLCRRVLALLPSDRPDSFVGWTWVSLTDIHCFRGQLKEALGSAERSIVAQKATGQPVDLAYAILIRAKVRRLVGDLDGFRADLKESETLLRKDGPPSPDPAARLALERGLRAIEDGSMTAAEPALLAALDTDLPTTYLTPRARSGMGLLRIQQGRGDEGLSEARKGLAVAASRIDRVVARNDLAQVYSEAGRLADARSEAVQALKEADAMGLPWEIARSAAMLASTTGGGGAAEVEGYRERGRSALRKIQEGAGDKAALFLARPDVRRLTEVLGGT